MGTRLVEQMRCSFTPYTANDPHLTGRRGGAEGYKKPLVLPHPPMQRGGMQPGDPGEQVREEPLGIAQEGPLALYAPKLLEKRQRQDLGVREPLERLVTLPPRVEQRVSVVDEAEQDRDRLFQGGEGGGMLRMGHPRFLSSGIRMAPFYSQTTQHSSRKAMSLGMPFV